MTKTPVQLDKEANAAANRAAADRRDDEKVEGPTVYTYPDGSQRVGTAPFPKESPLEQAAGSSNEPAAGPTPMYIPKGMKTEGEADAVVPSGLTKEQFQKKVAQQVESDVASGKDANTVNPTTSSDKPELAGVADAVEGLNPGNSDDLKKLTAGVKPDVKATKEQIDAAATQVARETKGVIADGKK